MKSIYHWRMDRTKDALRLLAVILLVFGCHLTKKKFMNEPEFDVQGHRGSRGLMPENTIPAMYKAIDLGVTTLEMDAVISKDNEVIVSHEPFFNIETKSLPASDGKYHPAPNEFVDLVMVVIRSKGIQERMTLQSFDFRTLQYARQKYPSVRTAMLIEDVDKRSLEQQLKDLGFTPTIYSPEYSLVNPSLIAKCHEMKMKIVPWTVNDKPTIERLKDMGVDGIITDYPDLFK